MADTPEPGSWYAIAMFLGTFVAAVMAGIAGARRGDERAKRGSADGDPVGLSGGALFIDSKPIGDLVKEVAGIRRALEKQARVREDADDKARDQKLDIVVEFVKNMKRDT